MHGSVYWPAVVSAVDGAVLIQSKSVVTNSPFASNITEIDLDVKLLLVALHGGFPAIAGLQELTIQHSKVPHQ